MLPAAPPPRTDADDHGRNVHAGARAAVSLETALAELALVRIFVGLLETSSERWWAQSVALAPG